MFRMSERNHAPHDAGCSSDRMGPKGAACPADSRHQAAGAALQDGDAPQLRLVFWELTAQCNLQCRHCRAESPGSASELAGRAHPFPTHPEHGDVTAAPAGVPGELGTRELLQAARDIRAAGDPILILTGGEPLSRPDFFLVAEACTGLFSRVAMATNGTLIDGVTAGRIVNSGIQRVSISIDGADADTHDTFRGQAGSFDDALRGYDALRQAGMSMQINVTVTRYNISQLEDLLQLALARGADAFHVFMLVPVGCGAEINPSDRLGPERVEEALTWLFHRARELCGRLHIKATCAPQYYRIMKQESRGSGITAPTGHGLHAVTRGCLAGSSVCFVSRHGDVQPCGYLPLKVGNVTNQTFADIWRAAGAFRSLRDPSQLKGKCGACGFRVVCQGCRARAFADTGNFLEADPDCAYVPSLSKRELRP